MKYAITERENYSLATITVPHTQTVTAYISVDLHDVQNATVHATELVYTDMILSGAGTMKRTDFLDAVNQLGARVAVTISDSILTVTLRSKSDVFKKVLQLTKTMLESPRFDASELTRVKQTVIGAIKESRENSSAIAHEGLRNTLYGAGDRRTTPKDTDLINATKKLSRANLIAYHKKVHAYQWTCSIAGVAADISQFEKMVIALTKTKRTPASPGTHTLVTNKKQLVLSDIPSRQNIDFSIGSNVPITLHHPDFLPLTFGIAVLGKWGGFAGRLMSTVREQEGLTYGIYAKTESFLNKEEGYWRVMTFFAPEKALQGLQSTFREIARIHTHGITTEELRRFKEIVGTSDALKNDSTSSLLGELHGYHIQQFSLEEIAEHKRRMTAVTLDEVNAALKKYLDPALLTISGAGPTKKIEKELRAFIK